MSNQLRNQTRKMDKQKSIERAFIQMDATIREIAQSIGVLNMRLTSLMNTVEVMIQLCMDEGVFTRNEFGEARMYYQQFLTLLGIIDKQAGDLEEAAKANKSTVKFFDKPSEEIAEFIFTTMINNRMTSGVLARYSDRLASIFNEPNKMEQVITLLEEKILKYEADLRLKDGEQENMQVDLSAVGGIGSNSTEEVLEDTEKEHK